MTGVQAQIQHLTEHKVPVAVLQKWACCVRCLRRHPNQVARQLERLQKQLIAARQLLRPDQDTSTSASTCTTAVVTAFTEKAPQKNPLYFSAAKAHHVVPQPQPNVLEIDDAQHDTQPLAESTRSSKSTGPLPPPLPSHAPVKSKSNQVAPEEFAAERLTDFRAPASRGCCGLIAAVYHWEQTMMYLASFDCWTAWMGAVLHLRLRPIQGRCPRLDVVNHVFHGAICSNVRCQAAACAAPVYLGRGCAA